MSSIDALRVAAKAHEGQRDKAGNAYLFHPIRVYDSLLISGYRGEVLEVALLHDVVEDHPDGLELMRKGGIEESIIEIVLILTRRVNENYDDYLARVAANPMAALVKYYDACDNLRRIPGEDEEDRQVRVSKYERVLGLMYYPMKFHPKMQTNGVGK